MPDFQNNKKKCHVLKNNSKKNLFSIKNSCTFAVRFF